MLDSDRLTEKAIYSNPREDGQSEDASPRHSPHRVSRDDNLDCHLASNSTDSVHASFVQVIMNSGDNEGPDRDVRERIVNLMQSIGQGPQKQIPAEELQKLKSAASRLDQILKAGANADQQVLKSAAARLDQLLSDIREGKDVTSNLKRRGNSGT